MSYLGFGQFELIIYLPTLKREYQASVEAIESCKRIFGNNVFPSLVTEV